MVINLNINKITILISHSDTWSNTIKWHNIVLTILYPNIPKLMS